MKKGIERVKRVTCEGCTDLDWLAPGMCGKIFGVGSHDEDIREYLEKRFENRNGCSSYSLLHFTHKGHNYRPGFMRLKEEENGEMWIYYDHDREQKYDSSYHRPNSLGMHGDTCIPGGR